MKSIIVAVDYYANTNKIDTLIEELVELCLACDIKVTYHMMQKLTKPHPTSYIGKGKVEELLYLIENDDIELVIFNEELTPSQMKYLNTLLPCEVVDRTGIILKIFEDRAQTKEAKLQVEMAKLNYLLPRLVGANISKIGQQGGSGFRGAGEKQIELDRRKIRYRLSKIDKEIEELAHTRKTQRSKRNRSSIPIVALVGYTNSGKSTVMNYFMANKDNKKVFEKNMVFASLQTSTRLVELEDNYQFLLIDTVGFVQDLPTHLFKAFRSTLEEVLDADLLIQVIDSSDDQYEEHSKTTNAILQELGTDQIPMIYVYNKIDLNKYGNVYPLDPFVFISAKEKKNMDTLTKMITKRLFKDERYYKIKIPYEMGTDFTTISRTFHIISTKYLEDGMYLELACSPSRVHVFEKYLLIN